MDNDEESVPGLVDVDAQPQQNTDFGAAKLQDLSLTKVPLTIVTGWF